MIDLRHFSVSYGVSPVLSSVQAGIPGGSFVVCGGPSGSGKTTLAKAITGILPSNARVGGSLVVHGPVASIWQEPSLGFSPYRRIGDQVADVLEARGEPRRGSEPLLALTGVDRLATAYPHEVSAGQIQRAAIARALAVGPRLLIADEPSASLDPENERQIVALVDRLRRERGMAVLWMTHRPAAVAACATDYWRIENGHLTTGDDAPLSPPSAIAPGIAPGEPVVRMHAVSKGYREPVLRDAGLVLRRGATVTLRGPSGSGKSTLARIVAGIEAPDAGVVEREGRVELVWPDPAAALNPAWRVDEAVAEPLAVRGVSRADRRSAALAWLDRVHLPRAYAARRVREVSGGERRRLGIARAMITAPACVVFDEADNGLDGRLRGEIAALLAGWQRESRAAYLWITHSGEPAFAGESFIMRNGRPEPDA